MICIVEAMKMENEITAHRSGVVTDLSVKAGEPVRSGQVICVVSQDGKLATSGPELIGPAPAGG